MTAQKQPSDSIERIAWNENDACYRVFSAYDKEVLFLAPEQLLDLRDWVNANETLIRQDAQKGDH